MLSSERLPSLVPIHRPNKVLIELFGEATARQLYSKVWSQRQAGVQQMAAALPGLQGEGRRLVSECTGTMGRCAADKMVQVLLASLELNTALLELSLFATDPRAFEGSESQRLLAQQGVPAAQVKELVRLAVRARRLGDLIGARHAAHRAPLRSSKDERRLLDGRPQHRDLIDGAVGCLRVHAAEGRLVGGGSGLARDGEA